MNDSLVPFVIGVMLACILCGVIEGCDTKARQAQHVAAGRAEWVTHENGTTVFKYKETTPLKEED